MAAFVSGMRELGYIPGQAVDMLPETLNNCDHWRKN